MKNDKQFFNTTVVQYHPKTALIIANEKKLKRITNVMWLLLVASVIVACAMLHDLSRGSIENIFIPWSFIAMAIVTFGSVVPSANLLPHGYTRDSVVKELRQIAIRDLWETAPESCDEIFKRNFKDVCLTAESAAYFAVGDHLGFEQMLRDKKRQPARVETVCDEAIKTHRQKVVSLIERFNKAGLVLDLSPFNTLRA